jgi:hypothetical protein
MEASEHHDLLELYTTGAHLQLHRVTRVHIDAKRSDGHHWLNLHVDTCDGREFPNTEINTSNQVVCFVGSLAEQKLVLRCLAEACRLELKALDALPDNEDQDG